MIHVRIYLDLTIYITQTNNTSPCPNEKLNMQSVYTSSAIFKGFLLQVARASYVHQVLTPTACKLLNFFIWKVKLINFPDIHFSIFHLHLLHIIKFPFNILTFYFQTIHFLLPFSKYYFNLILVLFLDFSFHYSLNKVPSFPGFLICITMKLGNLAFWRKWLGLV